MNIAIETSRQDLIESLNSVGGFRFRFDYYKDMKPRSQENGVHRFYLRRDYVYVYEPLAFVDRVNADPEFRTFLSRYLETHTGVFCIFGNRHIKSSVAWSMMTLANKYPWADDAARPETDYYKEYMVGAFCVDSNNGWSSHS